MMTMDSIALAARILSRVELYPGKNKADLVSDLPEEFTLRSRIAAVNWCIKKGVLLPAHLNARDSAVRLYLPYDIPSEAVPVTVEDATR